MIKIKTNVKRLGFSKQVRSMSVDWRLYCIWYGEAASRGDRLGGLVLIQVGVGNAALLNQLVAILFLQRFGFQVPVPGPPVVAVAMCGFFRPCLVDVTYQNT